MCGPDHLCFWLAQVLGAGVILSPVGRSYRMESNEVLEQELIRSISAKPSRVGRQGFSEGRARNGLRR